MSVILSMTFINDINFGRKNNLLHTYVNQEACLKWNGICWAPSQKGSTKCAQEQSIFHGVIEDNFQWVFQVPACLVSRDTDCLLKDVQWTDLEDRDSLLLHQSPGMLRAHDKRLEILTSGFLLVMQLITYTGSLGHLYTSLWQVGLREWALENADTLATAGAGSNTFSIISDPRVSCFLPSWNSGKLTF